jgi:mRNA interferase RelE/StbE
MSWAIAVSNRARKSLKRVPAADQARIMAALSAMQTDPLSGDLVKLSGQDAFRRRVGNYRIIFRIDFKALAIGIIDIQRRTTTTYR